MQDPDAVPVRGPTGRFLDSLGRLLATALTIGRTRLELLTVELQLEVQRTAALVVWTLVALFAAGAGLLLAGVTVIIVFWNSHRVLAAAIVTAVFLLLALMATAILAYKIRTKPPMLEGTLAELDRDRVHLEERS
jgi:uncharacterized membrane protein YqjE